MQEQEKVVRSVKVEEPMGGVSILIIDFTDGEFAYMIAAYNEVTQYIDQKVLVSFRKDIRNGQYYDFVNQLTKLSIIAALDKEENTKLFVNDMPDTGSNLVFRDMQLAEFKANCIVYCDRAAVGTSTKATWVEFKVLDRKRNVAMMKIFNPENNETKEFEGKYLLCDIRKTKYGLSTQEAKIKENLSIQSNPELELARQFLLQELQSDEVLLKEVLQLNLIDAMLRYSDSESIVETGYVLVQTAMEMAMAAEFKNLSKDVDSNLMRRGIIARKLFVLTHNENQTLSKEIQSVMKLTSTKISSKKLIGLVEASPSKVMLEHALLGMIDKTVALLLANTKSEGFVLSRDKLWGK